MTASSALLDFAWGNSLLSVDAGPDQLVTEGDVVLFDGSGSWDDGGWINWTWTFEYGGETVRLWGVAPSFQFDEVGAYDITLTVKDAAGYTATDTMVVTVEVEIPELGSAWTVAVLMAAMILALVVSRGNRDKGRA